MSTLGKLVSIRDAVKFAKGYLSAKKIESFDIDADVLIMHLLDLNRVQLVLKEGDCISDKDYNKYTKMVKKRAKNIPVAYIINKCEFFSLPFYVDERVLIPRPDTEHLVESVISSVNNTRIPRKNHKILEIGTGSGCISISVAKNCVNTEITATDISSDALEIAKMNAERNGVSERIKFVQSNLFESLENEEYDIVVSNPPYIPSSEIPKLQSNVKDYEPKIALDGGKDGLHFYNEITPIAKSLFPKYGGAIFYEIGFNQASAVNSILEKNGFLQEKIFVKKDYNGNDRVIYAIC